MIIDPYESYDSNIFLVSDKNWVSCVDTGNKVIAQYFQKRLFWRTFVVKNYEDSCIGKNELKDYFCIENTPYYSYEECILGCEEDSCLSLPDMDIGYECDDIFQEEDPEGFNILCESIYFNFCENNLSGLDTLIEYSKNCTPFEIECLSRVKLFSLTQNSLIKYKISKPKNGDKCILFWKQLDFNLSFDEDVKNYLLSQGKTAEEIDFYATFITSEYRDQIVGYFSRCRYNNLDLHLLFSMWRNGEANSNLVSRDCDDLLINE